MTGYGNIAKTKQDGSWVKYVFSLIPPPPKKKIMKLCSASRMTFRAWFYIGRQFGTLSGFLRNTFRKRTRQKKPRNILQTKKFQDYLFLSNERQFIPRRLRFQAWLNLYITLNSIKRDHSVINKSGCVAYGSVHLRELLPTLWLHCHQFLG